MPEYTEDDILRMQQEAVRRVQDMQIKAQKKISQGEKSSSGRNNRTSYRQEGTGEQKPVSLNNLEELNKSRSGRKVDKKRTDKPNPFFNLNLSKLFNFKDFKLDFETILILIIIYLILTEETDWILLVALLYIILS